MNRVKLSRYWLAQLAGWGCFALINIFFAYSFDKLSLVFFVRLGIFLFLGLAITQLMRYFIIRFNTLQKNFESQVLQFLMITLFFSFVASILYSELLMRLPGAVVYLMNTFPSLQDSQALQNLASMELFTKNEMDAKEKNYSLLILNGAFNFFLYFFIWNLIYFIYHYVGKSRKQQLDTLQLESLVKELELQTIKAHINPHFIFNALNSIRALIDENPARARTAVTELSNLLRSSLKIEKGETVSLKDELKIVKDYLALEHIRFEDRLKIEYKVQDDTLNCEVPPMMLQTLVENAIKHGISKQMQGGKVKIISGIENNYHVLAVQNTGHLNGGARHKGFGISSTKDRLHLLYGNKAAFEIRQVDPTMVEAKILIPVLN